MLMTREERCKLFEAKGFKYDPETGIITTHKGKVPKSHSQGHILLGIKSGGKRINLYGHHYAWWMSYREVPDEKLEIDHEDRVKTNNRISNLRLTTTQANSINSDRIENCKGYDFHKKSGKWRARIQVDGKLKPLGCFNTEEEARQAYLTALQFYYPDRYEDLKNKNKL